jgi:hypothetical protein
VGRVYPRLSDIQDTSVKIAVSVIEKAYELNLATVYPKPANLEQFVKDQLYHTEYPTFIPDTYEYDLSSHQ